MPIDTEEFESRGPGDMTNAERVLGFLARNGDEAYRAVEIAEATGVVENSVHPVLTRLAERGLVRHRQPYWTIGDPETVRDAPEFRSIQDQFGEDDLDV